MSSEQSDPRRAERSSPRQRARGEAAMSRVDLAAGLLYLRRRALSHWKAPRVDIMFTAPGTGSGRRFGVGNGEAASS